jgi:hypothetical protein
MLAAVSYVCQSRGNLDADEAVRALSLIVIWPQDVRRHLEILDFETFEQRLGVAVRIRREQQAQCIVIGCSPRNCFVEDGGIARDTMHAIVLDQSLELTAGEQIATNVIQPDGLPSLEVVLVSS